LPELVREALSELGHMVAEEGLAGAEDQTVLAAFIADDRVLSTLDLDFSDIRVYPPGSYPGIWVPRPPKQTFKTIEALVRAGVRLSTVGRVAGQLWIIDDVRVRIRDGDV